MAESLEDLGFKPIGVEPQVGGPVSPIQKIGNAAASFNKTFEGTGLPNAATAFFQGGSNALANMANFGADIAQIPNQYRIPKVNFGADTSTAGGGAGDILGAGSTYFLPGGAVNALGAVPKGVSLVKNAFPEIAKGLSSARNVLAGLGSKVPNALQRVAAGTPGAALFGASQAPEDRLEGAALGAAGNVGANAALMGLPKAINALNPMNALRNWTRPNASKAEVENVLKALPKELRDQVPIGELIDSPALRDFQTNTVANLPFSGMRKPYEKLNKHIQTEGGSVMNGMLKGRDINDAPKAIYDSIENNYKTLSEKVNNAYDNYRAIAKEEKIPFVSTSSVKVIDDELNFYTKELEKHPRMQEQYGKIIDALKDYKGTLTGLSSEIKPSGRVDVITGKPIPGKPDQVEQKLDNFTDAEKYRRAINNDYGDALASRDSRFMGVLGKLKGALKEDFTSSAGANSKVKAALDEADKLYKQKVPFEEELGSSGSIGSTNFFDQFNAKKAGKPLNLDTFLPSYLKVGKNKDYAATLENLTRLIPDQSTKDMLGAYALRAGITDKGIDPSQLNQAYKKLGKKQKDILFNPKPENEKLSGDPLQKLKQLISGDSKSAGNALTPKARLDKLETISKTYPELFSINYNPPTGNKLAKGGPSLVSLGAAGASALSGNIGLALSSLGTIPLMGLSGYAARKALTNPSMRDALLAANSIAMPFSPTTQKITKTLGRGAVAKAGEPEKKKSESLDDLGFKELSQ